MVLHVLNIKLWNIQCEITNRRNWDLDPIINLSKLKRKIIKFLLVHIYFSFIWYIDRSYWVMQGWLLSMFYKIDCCTAIHGRIWINNVPNKGRIIMLPCSGISFVMYDFFRFWQIWSQTWVSFFSHAVELRETSYKMIYTLCSFNVSCAILHCIHS